LPPSGAPITEAYSSGGTLRNTRLAAASLRFRSLALKPPYSTVAVEGANAGGVATCEGFGVGSKGFGVGVTVGAAGGIAARLIAA
jgi:hypothetical protein